ncbi:MAG: hypothetical protein IK123_02390 [Lachnospiraceae bacterium]|nr:hypothetical protein [Lachnospiraceae bacterium]
MSDTKSEDVTDGQDEELGTEYDYNVTKTPDVIDFTEYNGLKWICDYDSSSVIFNSATENGCDAEFNIDKDIDGNSGFYKGTVKLDASQVTSADNKFYFRGVPSADNKVSVDIDINPDGTMMVAMYKDDGGYASCELTCKELVDRIIADSTGTTGNLEDYKGKYKASNGDTFIIREMMNGVVGFGDLELYSIDGWDAADEGHVLELREEEGALTVEIITYFTAAEGKAKINSDGKIELILKNGSTSKGSFDYDQTFTKVQ